MSPVEDVSARLAEPKPRLEREYSISELGIFGSYARGEQRSDSDLDVLVAFERPVMPEVESGRLNLYCILAQFINSMKS